MSNNTPTLIKNNLIAIAVHICLGFALYPLLILICFGMGGHSLGGDIFVWLAMGLYTIIAFCLYFLAGMSFLHNAKNTLMDVFSVVVLAIVLFAAVLLSFMYNWDSLLVGSLVAPFYILGMIISYIFQIPFDDAAGAKNIFVVLSLLPSLSIWAGLSAKKYVDAFSLRQQQSTLKNKLLFIISKKKQSFILFIALICSIYLLLAIIFIIMLIAYAIGF